MKQDIEKQGFKLGGLSFVNWRRGQGADQKALQGTIMKLEQYRSAMRLASSEIEYRNRVIRTLTTFNYQASRQTKTTAVLQLALSQALKTARSEVGAIILIDPAGDFEIVGTTSSIELAPNLVFSSSESGPSLGGVRIGARALQNYEVSICPQAGLIYFEQQPIGEEK